MYIRTKKSDWNPNSNTLEPDQPRHDRSAAHVIAQQCSSANFVSLRFLFARITTARLSKVLLSQSRLFYFSKIACMKLRQSVSVCTCVCVGADNMCVCVCVWERERYQSNPLSCSSQVEESLNLLATSPFSYLFWFLQRHEQEIWALSNVWYRRRTT